MRGGDVKLVMRQLGLDLVRGDVVPDRSFVVAVSKFFVTLQKSSIQI
jgi:hypothetical protein